MHIVLFEKYKLFFIINVYILRVYSMEFPKPAVLDNIITRTQFVYWVRDNYRKKISTM